VDVYTTDEQQVEAIKKWWQENGKSVIVGLAIGAAAVVGWRSWTESQESYLRAASDQYSQVLNAVAGGNHTLAVTTGDALLQEYADAPYAALGALALAKAHYEQGEKDAALTRLQWVLDNADTPELKQVALLRMGRLTLDMGDLDGALALVQKGDSSGSFAGAYAELRGDILVRKGDKIGARTAYETALASGSGNNQTMLRLKLDDLGAVTAK
jgi:predicted negative regulator of RcsB-dependent stress response